MFGVIHIIVMKLSLKKDDGKLAKHCTSLNTTFCHGVLVNMYRYDFELR